MKQSELFTKTLRQAPKDEEALNAQLLIRAGFVNKLMAGVYSYLPLGLKTLNKIAQVVREEMDAIGGQEILMPVLHPSEIWKKTGAWDKVDVLFKIKSRTGKDYALGQSEEEVVVPLVMHYVNNNKDLPLAAYQIHWKYRDELRAKSGLLRGREFFMKDMYSFHENQEDFERFYEVVKKAYFKVFERMGLTAKATEASGGSFSEKISYEFMVLTDAGEDDIFYCQACEFCVNAEIAKQKEGDKCPKCGKGKLNAAKASEVGNVFDLGQKYGKDFELGFIDEKGEKKYPVIGCYGLGVSRLMGVLVEKFHDDKGIIWPKTASPFDVHLINIAQEAKSADKIYLALQKEKISVLYDQRQVSAGVKFTDSDLIGIPLRVLVSDKTIKSDSVELKERSSSETQLIKIKELTTKLKK
ncbi:MAG TPA: aminoacyl--tRNA ligase-related protein [Patescibacteria group bacterium]|jgi:prolyl-tRNA synthetase|nr:aminoacyl--tRNA ligase-related protein [Patescibacteria group bacterium]